MDFVKESVKEDITDWNLWRDKYVYKYSGLYKEFKKYETYKFLYVELIYQTWIELLRSPDITIEPLIIPYCAGICRKKYKYRFRVISADNIPIATIDRFGKEYKYVHIPYQGLEILLTKYHMEYR